MKIEPSSTEALLTIQDLIRWGASRFVEAGLSFGHGTDNALDESTWLVLHALSLPMGLPDSYRHCRVVTKERQAVLDILQQRIETRSPAAYLTGKAWFCGLEFEVNQSVLIPRSPIAELIENGFTPWLDSVEVMRVLDLCTGSGCIGIACAYAYEDAEITLSDISDDALAVANRNIKQHQLKQRVTAKKSNVFDQLGSDKYEVIVSNPPYVDAEDMAALADEYRAEPRLGLEAGEDGLDIVHQIMTKAGDYLTEDGVLIVEVGNSEAALAEAYPDFPFIWLEFEHGGQGVFLTTKRDLTLHLNL